MSYDTSRFPTRTDRPHGQGPRQMSNDITINSRGRPAYQIKSSMSMEACLDSHGWIQIRRHQGFREDVTNRVFEGDKDRQAVGLHIDPDFVTVYVHTDEVGVHTYVFPTVNVETVEHRWLHQDSGKPEAPRA